MEPEPSLKPSTTPVTKKSAAAPKKADKPRKPRQASSSDPVKAIKRSLKVALKDARKKVAKLEKLEQSL